MALTIKDLCSLAQVNTEDEENQHIAELLKDPIDRKTTGEACVKLLGYDPTVVFDQIEMTKILDEFIADNNLGDVRDKKEQIIINAMDIINENRSTYQITALEDSIAELFDTSEIPTMFELWAKKHYSSFEDFCIGKAHLNRNSELVEAAIKKIMYDSEFDEDEVDIDEEESPETTEVGNDPEGFTSDEDDDDDFDDDDDYDLDDED